jgi:hypothetical protein
MYRARGRNEGHILAGLEQITSTVARPWPTTVLWRWRYELILGLGLPTAVYALAQTLGLPATILFLAPLVAAAVLLRPVRRFFVRRAWCVITPHRVRSGCAQARIHSRAGRLPAVLHTSRADFGERVLLWCPAGVSVEDFESARPQLAASCWAIDVQAQRSYRYAHLITVDIIRRDLPRTPDPLIDRIVRHSSGLADDDQTLPPHSPPVVWSSRDGEYDQRGMD